MRYLITGGAGFIGSNLTNQLLSRGKNSVTVFDNFSAGKKEFLRQKNGLEIIKSGIENTSRLMKAMKGKDVVFHLASNSDISKAAAEPSIDFYQGVMLTHLVLEAMRKCDVKRIIFPSGSGVYGDAGSTLLKEDYPYRIPVSPYGAGKISSEAMIAAYSAMFGIKASVLRFANVIGRHQTHGVIYDFIKKLRRNSYELNVLGNGRQRKSYIYIDDILNALLLIEKKQKKNYDYFNVSTGDYRTVKQIADAVVKEMKIKNVKIKYGEETTGWKGDVPLIKLSSEKIKSFGWKPVYTSKQAVILSIKELLKEID